MRPTVTVVATSVASMDRSAIDQRAARLPADDQVRAAAMTEGARRRFIVGRLLAQQVVGRLARVDAAAVVLAVDVRGRPLVVGLPLFVSIAHSGDYVLVGVAHRRVGVDVERLSGAARRPELERRVCSQRELRRLDRIADVAARRRAFMAIWTRKEAYGKALGVGLDFTLRSVTAGPSGSRIRGVSGVWSVRDVHLDGGYAAAVVAAGRYWRVEGAMVPCGDL